MGPLLLTDRGPLWPTLYDFNTKDVQHICESQLFNGKTLVLFNWPARAVPGHLRSSPLKRTALSGTVPIKTAIDSD